MANERLWVVGPGRLGLALGTVLHGAGAVTDLAYTGLDPQPPDHPLFRRPQPVARYSSELLLPDPPPTGIIVAVPDREIAGTAVGLAGLSLPRGVPVLHTSGALGADVLAPISAAGNPVGSVHPLAAIAEAHTGPDRLRGAWFAVEGDDLAVRFGRWIASAAGGRILRVDPGGKPLYHAAAVVASNYVVALLALAERLAARAGLDEVAAREALVELAVGAARNVQPEGPGPAITGPIARGDEETVAAHLAELSGRDRALYSVLARETLALARSGGLDADACDRLERMLGGEE